MAAKLVEKLYLSAKGLLSTVRKSFETIIEPAKDKRGCKKNIPIVDCTMAALAMFKLKFPSLLQFDKKKNEIPIKNNLENLFGLKKVPCDTYMRERLDEVDPNNIRKAFKSIFASLQRGKALEKYIYLDGKYLLLTDGTGFFSSKEVQCQNCCKKKHSDGTTTYYHQMLGAAIVHPDYKEVIPLCPEPIMNSDGSTKNDCERHACERLLRDFRREHPHLPVIVAEDGLSSNVPHLRLLKELDMSFITVVSPTGNKALFEHVNSYNWSDDSKKWEKAQAVFSFIDPKGYTHKFRFVNNVPLNASHNFNVNFLEYWVTDKKGKQNYHNSWVTDIEITLKNVYAIARGGRARWYIENEVFNTLKNQDYNLEHNYGHGYKHLSTVFARLMVLAFLIDQAEQMCCSLFQNALKAQHGMKSYLWRSIREFFSTYIILSWESLYGAIIAPNSREVPVLNTS